MRMTTLHCAAFLIASAICCGAYAQTAEPIRIDRPGEGALVETETEVAGVASPGATVEVWVDRVFVVDTVAEPDGWYVTRIKRPPTADDASRIFVHELDADGQRVSSAVVRVTWSETPVPEEPIPPPPDVAVDEPVEQGSLDVAGEPIATGGAGHPNVRTDRSGRVVVEYLVSMGAGVTGALIGALLATPFGQPQSAGRVGVTVLFGSIGAGMASAGAVYGVGTAMQGNGSFTWTAIGGLTGAFLVVAVALGTDGRAGAAYVPVVLAAFGLPVLAYELTSDTSRRVPKPAQPNGPQPTVGVSPEGTPTVGVWLRW